MPIHDVGYRRWSGPRTHSLARWWTITEAGFQAAFKNAWVRRLMIAAWIPVLVIGYGIFSFEKLIDTSLPALVTGPNSQVPPRSFDYLTPGHQDELRKEIVAQSVARQLSFLPNSQAITDAAEVGDMRQFRHRIWSTFLASFLRYPQLTMTLLLVGLIVPPLISRDVRSRAFLLYYSRPITRWEYLLGKLCIPALVLSLITLVPALGLYLFGLMMSPDLSVVLDTWDLPFRVIGACLFCIVPVSLISLLLSAMTQESRFAAFGWFAVWILGAVTWFMIYAPNQFKERQDGMVTISERIEGADVGDVIEAKRELMGAGSSSYQYESNWSLVSLYATIGKVQAWIFGLEPDPVKVVPSLVMLILLSTIAAIWLYRRVSAPVRI